MSHDAHDIKKEVRRYLIVFVALLIGTVLTVAVNSIQFGAVAVTVAVALFIASVKAFLVAGYFMHLISEKKMIYGILASTAFFFIGMMYLTVWARGQMPHGTIYYEKTQQQQHSEPGKPQH
jgi:cytochrome c oxidase subunit 4